MDETFLEFPCVGRQRVFLLTRSKLEEYRASYPGVNVEQALRTARQWCIDNPKRRKTATGIPAFLTRWLSREQNRATVKSEPTGRAEFMRPFSSEIPLGAIHPDREKIVAKIRAKRAQSSGTQ